MWIKKKNIGADSSFSHPEMLQVYVAKLIQRTTIIKFHKLVKFVSIAWPWYFLVAKSNEAKRKQRYKKKPLDPMDQSCSWKVTPLVHNSMSKLQLYRYLVLSDSFWFNCVSKRCITLVLFSLALECWLLNITQCSVIPTGRKEPTFTDQHMG